MVTRGRILPMLFLLGACGSARAQGPTGDGLDRPIVYEVASEQARQAAPAQEQGFIEVSGSGAVSVAVDRARVSFAVETRRPTAAEAASVNADLMDSVLGAIRGAGFAGLDVQTFGYSLSPLYSRQVGDTPPEITGYAVGNNVGVTIEDVDDVGRLLDIAIGAGANRVSRLAFEASDTEEARAAALAAAVENARSEAQVIAAALGRSLGPALEVRGGAQMPSPLEDAGALRLSAIVTTPIEVGDQIVRANVTIRFALGPAGGSR